MKVFADTDFFTCAWLDLRLMDDAVSLLAALQAGGGFLPVTRLLRMEFTNALQRLVFEARRGGQILRRLRPEFEPMAGLHQAGDGGAPGARFESPESPPRWWVRVRRRPLSMETPKQSAPRGPADKLSPPADPWRAPIHATFFP